MIEIIETTRTTAGDRMCDELCKTMPPEEAIRVTRARVKVRAVRTGYDTARVWTSTDGGPWVDDGVYRVAPEAGAVEPELAAEPDEPFDVNLAVRLAGRW